MARYIYFTARRIPAAELHRLASYGGAAGRPLMAEARATVRHAAKSLARSAQ
jgi:hypothetical protein